MFEALRLYFKKSLTDLLLSNTRASDTQVELQWEFELIEWEKAFNFSTPPGSRFYYASRRRTQVSSFEAEPVNSLSSLFCFFLCTYKALQSIFRLFNLYKI